MFYSCLSQHYLFLLQVNPYGVLSFRDQFFLFSPEPFPLFNTDLAIISPFWSIHNYNNNEDGQILFRISDDEELLNLVGSSISEAFFSPFSPLSLFIGTWVERPDQTNLILNQVNNAKLMTPLPHLHYACATLTVITNSDFTFIDNSCRKLILPPAENFK